ncbi:MAG: hypothetical protein EBU27_06060 [Opitutae bacterium]|nr:hypothetical protein [Opitutae bacterium]
MITGSVGRKDTGGQAARYYPGPPTPQSSMVASIASSPLVAEGPVYWIPDPVQETANFWKWMHQ